MGGGPDNPLENLGYTFDKDGNVTGINPIKYLNSLGMGNGSGSGDTYNTVINLLNPQDKEKNSSLVDVFKSKLLKQVIEGKNQGGYDPMAILKQQGFLDPTGYLKYVNQ